MNETKIIIKYMNAWFWHILAVIFLNTSIISFMLGIYVYGLGTALAMGGCEFMALKRQKELHNAAD